MLPKISSLSIPSKPVTEGLGFTDVNGSSFPETYELGRVIGRGGASLVRQARHRSTGQIFAVKHINKSSVRRRDHLRAEVTILKNARHRNIVSLLDVYETKDELILVMEYASGGELFDRIVTKGCYSEREAAEVTTNILEALAYLHKHNVVHRDIKPENILLATPNSDTEVKLSDFGIAKVLAAPETTLLSAEGAGTGTCEKSGMEEMTIESAKSLDARDRKCSVGSTSSTSLLTATLRGALNSRQVRAYSTCGTDCYMAPEVLGLQGTAVERTSMNSESTEGPPGYHAPVDMWAVGVVVYVLLSGEEPFEDDVMNGIYPRRTHSSCSQDMKISNHRNGSSVTSGSSIMSIPASGISTSASWSRGNWFAINRSNSISSVPSSMDYTLTFPETHWDGISDAAKSFVRGLLTVNPDSRLTATQALQHPWIRGRRLSTSESPFSAVHTHSIKRYVSQRKESITVCMEEAESNDINMSETANNWDL
eukprot:g3038.t1